MNFFFKKKPLVLNCVTNRRDVMTFAPIQKASKFYPEWWKQLPKTYLVPNINMEATTMKSCVGMRDLFQHGLIIPLWSDFVIDIGEIGVNESMVNFSDGMTSAIPHQQQQRGEYAPDNLFQHLKINSPWLLQCEEEVPFMWLEPTWNMVDIKNYKVLPAVIEYKYQYGTHINLIFTREQIKKKVFIPFSTPMAHIVPISERPLKINLIEDAVLHNKLCSEQTHVTFSNTYTNRKNVKQAACPFSRA